MIGKLLSFLGGFLGSLLRPVVIFFLGKRAGREAQHSDDLKATVDAQDKAKTARDALRSDSDYAARVRRTFTRKP